MLDARLLKIVGFLICNKHLGRKLWRENLDRIDHFSAKIYGSNFHFNCSYDQTIGNPVAELDIEGFQEWKMTQAFKIRQSQVAGYPKDLLGQAQINPQEQNQLNKRRKSNARIYKEG